MKRKDNKGRILQDCEYQGKDGRYKYRHTDINGKEKVVYSWRLTPTDKPPAGKKFGKSLRELEAELMQDFYNGVSRENMSCDNLFKEYISTKIGAKESTIENYRYNYFKFLSPLMGTVSISKIVYTDIKRIYKSLYDQGISYSTIKRLNCILSPCFSMAIKNGWIRKNPCEGAVRELSGIVSSSSKKVHALSKQQQEALVKFISSSKRFKYWQQMIIFLLGTGCRIGEASALQWSDCDFQNDTISIDKTVSVYTNVDGTDSICINTPKTDSGTRTIPMLKEVKQALLEIRRRNISRGYGKNTVTLDGYKDFVFINTKGNLVERKSFATMLRRMAADYNLIDENPKIEVLSPHMLRHTFCTRYLEVEKNIKIVQEIMGHADISTTMNIYNEIFKEDKTESFDKLEGQIKIS